MATNQNGPLYSIGHKQPGRNKDDVSFKPLFRQTIKYKVTNIYWWNHTLKRKGKAKVTASEKKKAKGC